MYRVLVTDSLSPQGLDLLKSHPEIEVVYSPGLKGDELKSALQEADGIVIRSGTKLTPDVLDGQTRLKVIARAGVGVDNIDLPAATRQGVIVSNTPDGNTISTGKDAGIAKHSRGHNWPARQSGLSDWGALVRPWRGAAVAWR